jgi:hypothetical protein
MHIMEYVGPPFVFNISPALTGIGSVAKHGVVSIGSLNFGMSPAGIWQTDGTSFKYIDDPQIGRYIQDNIDFSPNSGQPSKISAWQNDEDEEVIWSYPKGGDQEPSECLSYNYRTGAWSKFGFGRTSGMNRDVFDFPIAADKDGNVYFHNKGYDADGSAMGCFVQSKPLALGSDKDWKLLDAIRVQTRNLTGTLQMRVGTQETLDDPISWNGPFDLDTGFELIYMRLEGFWISVEFKSEELGAAWRISGFQFFGEYGGGVLE